MSTLFVRTNGGLEFIFTFLLNSQYNDLILRESFLIGPITHQRFDLADFSI